MTHRHEGAEPDRVETDAQPVRRGRTDPNAFADLYESHYPRIFSYAMRTVMNVHIAEDVTGETFLRALRGFNGFKPNKGVFANWLYRIATNIMTDHFRRRAKGVFREDGAVTYDQLHEKGILLPSATTQPLEQFEEYQRLHRSIRTLKPVYGLTVVLYYFEEKTLKEIAGIMGCRAVTARWRLHRARRLLSDRLACNKGGKADDNGNLRDPRYPEIDRGTRVRESKT